MEGLKIVVTILFLVAGFWYARNYVNKNEPKELNADEAKTIAEKNRIIQAKKEIERINKELQEAVFIGEIFLATYSNYDNEVEFYYKSKGYSVTYCDKLRGKTRTIITWG